MANGGYDGSIRIDSRVDTKGFNRGISSMGDSVKRLGGMIGVALSAAAVISFGRSSVQAASDMASALIGLESITAGMGKDFGQAKTFIDSFIADGLVPATSAITAYKNLALRGYSTAQIEKTMIALKDSAAFGRQAALTMGQAVQGATEGLKNENSILVDNAGVTKNVSKMWADYARAHGLSAAQMTKEQKIMAEVEGIMQETRFQTGDAAKAAGTYAGQMSALGVSFMQLKAAVGNAVIPVIQAIIPYIRAAITWLTALFNTFAAFIGVLFGVKVATAAVASSTEDAANSAGSLAENTGEAGKAAKGALAPFDELNVLAQADGGGGAGGGTPPIPEIEVPPDGGVVGAVIDDMTARVEAFKATLHGMFDPTIDALGRLADALKPLGETAWSGLKWGWENIILPLGTWVGNDLLPAFLDILAAAASVLNAALLALAPMGQWLWDEFLSPIASWTGGAIVDILNGLADALARVGDWIGENSGKVQGFALILISLGLAIGIVSTAMGIAQAVTWVMTAATGALAAATALLASPIVLVTLAIAALILVVLAIIKYWPEISAAATKAWEWIKEVWAKAAAWFNENVIVPIKQFFAPLWEWLGIIAKDVWLIIKAVWDGVSAWFKVNVTEPLSGAFSAAWKAISGFFSGAWIGITETWAAVASWFKTNVTDPLSKAFNVLLYGESGDGGLVGAWEAAWTGISGFLKGILNGIIRLLNGVISGIVGGINGLIGAFNTVGAGIPGFVAVPKLAAPQIPELANGAVIPPNARFAAILGDQRNGRNIEAPEGLIRQIIQEEVGSLGSQNVNITFGGTMGELVRILKPEIDRENSRVGRSMVRSMA